MYNQTFNSGDQSISQKASISIAQLAWLKGITKKYRV